MNSNYSIYTTKKDGINLYIDYSGAKADNPRECYDHLGNLYARQTWGGLSFIDKHLQGHYFDDIYISLFGEDEDEAPFAFLPLSIIPDHYSDPAQLEIARDKYEADGFIWCTEEEARDYFKGSDKEPTAANALEVLREEIDEYNRYLYTEAFSYYLEGLDGEYLDALAIEMDCSEGCTVADFLAVARDYIDEKYMPVVDKMEREFGAKYLA